MVILGSAPYGVNSVLYRGDGRGKMGTYKSYVSEMGEGLDAQ